MARDKHGDSGGPGPLMGVKEASALLGVSTSNLRRLAGFPEPYQELASGPVWLASTISEFAEARGQRRAGAPA